MRLDIKRKFTVRTDRVKCVDVHPTEPWVLAALYNGSVWVWNYDTQQTVKTFEVSDLPVRAAKFVARKSWVVAGGDEMHVKVYNYNTFERVASFEAHADYIRSIAVHPTLPLILTSADDLAIKLWDWDKGWKCVQTYEGHSHFVMQVAFNPRDANTFASASLDCTVKVWSLGSAHCNFTLQGHDKGVNCVAYFPAGGDKPWLLSGADDHTCKVWDYTNKTCVATLTGHTQNVMLATFHPTLPLILTGAEDGSVKVWHAGTMRLEQSLNYGMERVWCVATIPGANVVAVGFDEGCVVLAMGREDPAISMDTQGKLVWAKHNEVLSANLAMDGATTFKDGEKVSISAKPMGTCDIYPSALAHSPNGRFVVATGDGEYIIYTALAWRNKAYGSALEVVWSPQGEYAARESNSRVRIFDKQFKERAQLNLNYAADAIFGGQLLAVRSAGAGFVAFYDWDTGALVRKVDAAARSVYWNDHGTALALCTDDSVFMLRYNAEAARAGPVVPDEGVAAALDVMHQLPDAVRTGMWVSPECFVYTTAGATNRLAYAVGGHVFPLVAHFDTPLYVVGYLSKDSRIVCADKECHLYTWALPLTVIEYQTCVLRGDLPRAAELMPALTNADRDRLAVFLEAQGLRELALDVATDPAHRFDLAIACARLDVAQDLAAQLDVPAKYRALAHAALRTWRFDVAFAAARRAGDADTLLLLAAAAGDREGLLGIDGAPSNVRYVAQVLAGDVPAAALTLQDSGKSAEAALLARAYTPQQSADAVVAWRTALEADPKTRNAAQYLADYPPTPDEVAAEAARHMPATYAEYAAVREMTLLEETRGNAAQAGAASVAATAGSEQ